MLRLLASAAVGVFADLFGMGDAYSYTARMRTHHLAAEYWVLVALLLGPLILNFGARRTLAISAAVWVGMAVTHTIVLIREVSADPTSHDLLPFEYIMLCVLAIPALLGAAIGRFAGQAWRAVRSKV
jgi:hypothetical protein